MLTAVPVATRRWHARPVLLVAAAGVLLHLVTAAGYGWHRDEMYFFAESQRMDWGFVSEPPLAPAIGWLSRQLFGESLVGLRLWPALAGAAVAVLAALVARELGGGRTAQLVAAITTSTSTIALSIFHLFGPTAFDQVAWAGCLLVLTKLLNGGDRRWWLAFGAIAGVGLLNKNTLVFLAIGLVVAVAVTPQLRPWLRSPLPWAAGLLAVAIASPYLVWQSVHGWPMLTVAGSVSEENYGPLLFLPMQVLTMNPLLAPVWIAGLWWLWRSATYRPFAVIWLVLLVALALGGGRSYYLLPAYLPLFAAGGVAVQQWRDRSVAVAAVLVAAAAVVVPSAVPVLPVEAQRHLPFVAINPVLSDPIGWPSYVQQIAAVRPGTPVLTANYGEAAAMELAGVPAYSGHNAYGTWGPPPAGTTEVVAVGMRDDVLARTFAQCSPVAVLDNPYGIDDEERGRVVHVCSGPLASWDELWPGIVHVDN